MIILTPCIVCKTQAQQKGSAFFADRGLDWPVTVVAGRTVHKACASDAEHLVKVVAEGGFEVDAAGVGRWTSNGTVPPADSAALLASLGLAGSMDLEASAIVRERETLEFLARYRASQPAEPSGEELFEMRAAFGPGARIVDVVSGRTVQL